MSSKEAILILSAGLGTRLRPATLKCPKPLIPVAGLDPLYFSVFKAHQIGIREFYINVHYLPALIRDAVKDFEQIFRDSTFTILDESAEVLGSGGALLNLFHLHREKLRGKALWATNADTLAEFSWEKLRSEADERSYFAVSLREDHLKRYNPLWCGESGQFVGVGKDLHAQGYQATHFVGVRRYSASDVEFLLNQNLPVKNIDLFKGIYQVLGNANRMPVCKVVYEAHERDNERSFFFDMTNEDFLIEAQNHLFNILEDSKAWTQALKTRYPNIHKIGQDTYVSGKLPENLKVQGPSVLIFSQTPTSFNSPATLGPRVSFICQRAFDLEKWISQNALHDSLKDLSILIQKKPTQMPHTSDAVLNSDGASLGQHIRRRVWIE